MGPGVRSNQGRARTQAHLADGRRLRICWHYDPYVLGTGVWLGSSSGDALYFSPFGLFLISALRSKSGPFARFATCSVALKIWQGARGWEGLPLRPENAGTPSLYIYYLLKQGFGQNAHPRKGCVHQTRFSPICSGWQPTFKLEANRICSIFVFVVARVFPTCVICYFSFSFMLCSKPKDRGALQHPERWPLFDANRS